MSEQDFCTKLRGGKSCDMGRAVAVAAEVLAQPELFGRLFNCLGHEEPIVRTRAAYAVSKLTERRADLLRSYKERFLDCLDDPAHPPLCRACMLQTLHRLDLTPDDREALTDTLRGFMFSASSIVKTFSLDLLTSFAEEDEGLRPEVMRLLWDALERGTPAMRARARKLMKQYRL